MPLAKSAPTTTIERQTSPTIVSDPIHQGLSLGGVPVDVYSYFNVPLANQSEREIGKLKDIVEWARNETGDGSIGDVLNKIRTLETHLGSPSGTDKRYDKLYNYCKMSLHIKELEKRRESLRRAF